MSTNAMHVAKTGLNAQQVRMQVIANNLSNVNTTGFKHAEWVKSRHLSGTTGF